MYLEMLRVWHTQSPMGVGYLRHLDMPRVFGETPQSGRASVVRTLRHDGQMEGH